jgi:hypothetical protein
MAWLSIGQFVALLVMAMINSERWTRKETYETT